MLRLQRKGTLPHHQMLRPPQQVTPNAAPATKSEAPMSPNIAPATKKMILMM